MRTRVVEPRMVAESFVPLLSIISFNVWAFGHDHKANDWRCTSMECYFGILVPVPYQFMENLCHPYANEDD